MSERTNTNLIHRPLCPEIPSAFGTIYPTAGHIVVLKSLEQVTDKGKDVCGPDPSTPALRISKCILGNSLNCGPRRSGKVPGKVPWAPDDK